MSLDTILLVIPISLLVGDLPVFPHPRNQDRGPSGVVGALLVVLLVLLLLGMIQNPIRDVVVVAHRHGGYRRIMPPALFAIREGLLASAPPLRQDIGG